MRIVIIFILFIFNIENTFPKIIVVHLQLEEPLLIIILFYFLLVGLVGLKFGETFCIY